MPTLETTDGKPVEVTPPDPDAVNRQFTAVMNDDGPEQELPRRAARGLATDEPRPARGRTAKPKAEKSRTTSKAAPALTHEGRVKGLQGWAQIGAGLFAMGGKATGSTALLADALTITDNAEAAAEAVAEMCDTDPRFAATIDRICAAGPWSGLIAVGVTVGSQMLRNHRPGMKIAGTVHPDELLKRAADQYQAAQAAAA